MTRLFPITALALAASAPALHATAPAPAPAAQDYSYVALADMALAAPLVLAADIADAIALKPAAAPGVAPGMTRYYVTAKVTALISGKTAVPPDIAYLVDLPTPSHRLKLKGVPVLLLAAPSARPGELRLIGPDAQIARTPEIEARLRAILKAKVAPDAPPPITGVTRTFHVAGSLPGEGETQIFLRTADSRPISLSILRRPGEEPRWAVALSEMIDASATAPPKDSLLWYRLACGLPQTLPEEALAGLEGDDARLAREDYQLVLRGLGPCERPS